MRLTTDLDLSQWLRNLAELEINGTCTSPQFWKPFHFVTLALLAKSAGMQDLRLPDEFESYAARMGLWDAAGIEPPYRVNKSEPAGRFMPAQALVDRVRVDDRAAALAEIMAKQCANASRDSLEVTLAELLNNCFDHARPDMDLFGLACAQSWPRGNLAQIAIADGGVGIRPTLEENDDIADRLARENACILAAEYGVTGKPHRSHSGYGLTLSKDVLVLNGGQLAVVSGTEIALFHRSRQYATTTSQRWQGTLVVLEWKINQPLDALAVYNSWPSPEGMTDEDFLP